MTQLGPMNRSQELAHAKLRNGLCFTEGGLGALVVDYAQPFVYLVGRQGRDSLLSFIEYKCCPICGSRDAEWYSDGSPRCDECGVGVVAQDEAPCSGGPDCDWTNCDSDWHDTPNFTRETELAFRYLGGEYELLPIPVGMVEVGYDAYKALTRGGDAL